MRYDSTNPRKTENLSHDFSIGVRNFHPVFGGYSQIRKNNKKQQTYIKKDRIAKVRIITAWIAGLVTQLIRYGAAGAGIFLFGMLFPILALYILFYFHMLGAGDIKLLSAVGGFLGVPAILKCMIVSFLSGAVLSIGIILVCGNLPQRLTKFFNYFQTYFTKRKYQKKTEPVPYYDGKWGMECIHFSVPVLMGVLLWIGGFY